MKDHFIRNFYVAIDEIYLFHYYSLSHATYIFIASDIIEYINR